MNKARKQQIKARNMGMSNVDLLKIKESAKKAAQTMEKEATEKAFLYMLAIPLNGFLTIIGRSQQRRKHQSLLKML